MHQDQVFTLESQLEGKVAVADTSSLLVAGTYLLSKIYSCELVIPAVVVQELEDKRSHPTLGVLARQWINLLEKLRVLHGEKLRLGVELPEGTVSLRVEPNHSNQKTLPNHLQDGSRDSTILAVAKNLSDDSNVVRPVVLLSNDTPMRLHATLDIGLDAYEFSAAGLEGEKNYKARVKLTITEDLYDELNLGHLAKNEAVSLTEFPENALEGEIGARYLADIYFHGNSNLQATLRGEGMSLFPAPERPSASHIFGKTVEQDVALTYLQAPATELPVVSIGGSAGTGKTLLTVATALQALKAREYQKIVVFRSLHEMGHGQEMGFLPGDVDAKMEAWAGAVVDALDVIALKKKPPKKNEGPTAVEDRKKITTELRSMIEVSPITYLRGRSLADSFIILDEAQNFSRTELLNIISRVGNNSKLVLLADPAQVDNKFLQSGNKADIWSVINRLQDEDVFAHVTLTKTERSRLAELASRILESENSL